MWQVCWKWTNCTDTIYIQEKNEFIFLASVLLLIFKAFAVADETWYMFFNAIFNENLTWT
jgi:hypothetical protein